MKFNSVKKEEPNEFRRLFLKIKLRNKEIVYLHGVYVRTHYILEGATITVPYKVVGWKYDEG